MNCLDYKIKKMARQTICYTSEEYEQRIDEMLKEIKQKNNFLRINPRLVFRLRYVIIVFAIICIFSIPTIAAVDYVKERMLKLDKEDQKKYQDTVETTVEDTEAVTYSRALREREEQRYKELFEAYEGTGTFPENELQIFNTVHDMKLAEVTKEECVVYVTETRTIYLPDRSLTDEEFLQIIDFYHKADYSLQQSEVAKQAKEKQRELENATPSQEAISEEQAAKRATHYMKAMFNVNSSDIQVDYGETDISEGDGDYMCSYVDDTITYTVVLQSATGTLTSIDRKEAGVDYYAEAAPIDEELFITKAKEAKSLFYKLYGEATEIASITCSYRKDENNNVPYGNVLYYVEFVDGNAGRFSYNINQDMFWQMIFFPHYREMRDAEAQGVREVEPDRVYIEIESIHY